MKWLFLIGIFLCFLSGIMTDNKHYGAAVAYGLLSIAMWAMCILIAIKGDKL